MGGRQWWGHENAFEGVTEEEKLAGVTILVLMIDKEQLNYAGLRKKGETTYWRDN